MDLEDHIARDPVLTELRRRVGPRLADDPGHDLAHAMRVATWTLKLDPDLPPRSAIAAALLHDVVNLPKDHPDRSKASEQSAQLAREWLEELGLEASQIPEICDAIEDHSYSRGQTPRSRLGCALQDADRLEALGAIGIVRTLLTGVRMGGRPFDPADPFAANRELDDKRHSVDHFYVKLLKLTDTMQSEGGRAEAEGRSAYMRGFLDQLSNELGHEIPESRR